MVSYFQDREFQNKLTAHVIKDRLFLKKVSKFLSPEDFKPRNRNNREQWARWIIASLALEYWNKYKQPINGMLRAEALNYLDKTRSGERQRTTLLKYVRVLRKKSLVAGDAILERVDTFKREKLRHEALEELIQLQTDGQLTDELMMQTCRDLLNTYKVDNLLAEDFLQDQQMEGRISRRFKQRRRGAPLFFIDPLDAIVSGVRRKELGLILAPYKRGKSMMLIHLALAFAVQGLNVMHVTCEDPKDTVEDRFDAMMTQLPIQELADRTGTFAVRFKRMRRMLRGRLFVEDATEGQCTLSWLEERLQERRERGEIIDVLIIDYDDEIEPPQKYKERRMEFAVIYRGLRRLMAKWDLIGWTAAQTTRDTENKKIIRGDDAAEDISKLRKVTCCISIGNGEIETHNSKCFYLFVAAHKNDQKHIGCYIVHNQKKSIFYDREATQRLLKKLKTRRMI